MPVYQYLKFPKLNTCPGCATTVNKGDCPKCGWQQAAPGQCPRIPAVPRMSNVMSDIIDDLTLQASPDDEGVWDAVCDLELTRIIYDEVRRITTGTPEMSDRLAMLLSSKLGFTPQFWFDLSKDALRSQLQWQVDLEKRRRRAEHQARVVKAKEPEQFTCAWWITASIVAVLVIIWLWAMWETAK